MQSYNSDEEHYEMNILIKAIIFTFLSVSVLNPVIGYSYDLNQDNLLVQKHESSNGNSLPSFSDNYAELESEELEELSDPTMNSKLFVITTFKSKYITINKDYQSVYLSIEPPPIKA